METIPIEVWQIIFKQISCLEDLQNCYNTCRRWRQMIAKMFSDKGMCTLSKILNTIVIYLTF